MEQSGAGVQTFSVGQHSALVSLCPIPEPYNQFISPINNYKKENPHTLQTNINIKAYQAAAFPSLKSQVPLPTKPASPHTMRGPRQEWAGVLTNCGNLGISPQTRSTSREFLFSHPPGDSGAEHCPLGERVSRDCSLKHLGSLG